MVLYIHKCFFQISSKNIVASHSVTTKLRPISCIYRVQYKKKQSAHRNSVF